MPISRRTDMALIARRVTGTQLMDTDTGPRTGASGTDTASPRTELGGGAPGCITVTLALGMDEV